MMNRCLEALESRVHLDGLIADVTKASVPPGWVTAGDAVSVTAVVANDSFFPEAGFAELQLVAVSTDYVWNDEARLYVVASQPAFVNIPGFGVKSFTMKGTLPVMAPDDYAFGFRIMSAGWQAGDAPLAIDISGVEREAAFRFGSYGARKNVKLQVPTEEQAGEKFVYSISGPGYGELSYNEIDVDNGYVDANFDIYGTTLSSKLDGTLVGGDGYDDPSNNLFDNGRIVTRIHGDIGAVGGKPGRVAPGSLAGFVSGMVIDGTVKQLAIGPSGGAKGTLFIGSGGPGVTITGGDVRDLSIFSQTPITALTFASWTDGDGEIDQLVAPSVGTMTIKGNFDAALILNENGSMFATALKKATIGGAVNGYWKINGDAPSVVIGATGSESLIVIRGTVKSLKIVGLCNGRIGAGALGAVVIGGSMLDAQIYAGDTYGRWEPLPRADHGSIGSFSVTGQIRGSWVLAGITTSDDGDFIRTAGQGGGIGKIVLGGFGDADSAVFAAAFGGAVSVGGQKVVVGAGTSRFIFVR